MSKEIKSLIQRMLVIALVLVFAAACSTADDATDEPAAEETEAAGASAIVIENAWVRPAVANNMSGMSMDSEATEEAMDMEATEEADDMEMEATEEAMDMDSEEPMSAMGGMTGAFMMITNEGDADDTLIGASTDVAGMVEIHETTIDENDVAKMQEVGQIAIPAGETVALQPGGYHVMLLNLKQDLVAGETVTLTLTFESGAEFTIEAPIQDAATEE